MHNRRAGTDRTGSRVGPRSPGTNWTSYGEWEQKPRGIGMEIGGQYQIPFPVRAQAKARAKAKARQRPRPRPEQSKPKASQGQARAKTAGQGTRRQAKQGQAREQARGQRAEVEASGRDKSSRRDTQSDYRARWLDSTRNEDVNHGAFGGETKTETGSYDQHTKTASVIMVMRNHGG